MPTSSSTTTSPHHNAVMNRVETLRQKLAGLVTLNEEPQSAISCDCKEFDAFMPGGALLPGMILELLFQQRGSGAGTLAMHCAKQAVTQQQGPLVVVDRERRFYPPAATARGIESRDLIIIRPDDERRGGMSTAEEIWAIDQALRCPGVAVVLAWMNKIDSNAYRRVKLAAEAGQTLAILLRPDRVRAFPTWADVQIQVTPSPSYTAGLRTSSANSHRENRDFQVTLVRQRGRAGSNTPEGTSLNLEIDEIQGTLKVNAGTVNRNEASTMHMAPRVAHPATRRRSTGA